MSKGCPLLVVASAQGPDPDLRLAPCGWADVGGAQQRADGGRCRDVAEDPVALRGADVMPVGGDEGVALGLGDPEPGRLEGWDEVDLSGPDTTRAPVGEHDPPLVAQHVAPPGVTMDH